MSQVKEAARSRILEGVFVLGCSLVGLGMGAPEGSGMRNTVQSSIQLVALAHGNMARNVANLGRAWGECPWKSWGFAGISIAATTITVDPFLPGTKVH